MHIDNSGISHEVRSNSTDLPCLCCGVCCSKFQPYLNLPEAQTIAANMGLALEQFLEDFTDHRWPGTQSFLIRHEGGSCVFLKPASDKRLFLCSIHSFKPSCCLEWKSSLLQPECREGLKKRWNLTLDASGKIAGPGLNLKEFHLFTRSFINP